MHLGKELAAALCLLAAGYGPDSEAQEPDPKLCEPSSHALDAVTAAPDMHRVLFEDRHVRVLEIVIPPYTVEPVHFHALPSVIMGETAAEGGARFIYFQYEMRDGRFLEVSRQDITPSPGYRAVWSLPEGPHAIANVGPVLVRFQRVEIKPEACSR
jgi:hypothetical protein